MRKLRHIAVCVLCAVGALLPVQFFGVTAAQAVTFTNLTLLNGWTAGPFGTGNPSVAIIGGIVHFSHRDVRHQPGTVRPAGVVPPGHQRVRSGGHVQRHERAPRHRAQRGGDRGAAGPGLRRCPMLHLARRGVVRTLEALAEQPTG